MAAKRSRWIEWLTKRKGRPFPFQKQAWTAYLQGNDGLIHAPTGQGKTYAAWGGPIEEWLREAGVGSPSRKTPEPIRVLWITPLRALANDLAESLRLPVDEMGLPWSVELRTGDTPAAVRQRQRRRFPTALVTTPESLTLLLTHEETLSQFSTLRAVVVDEWHELVGSKRGVQTELCLARLRYALPGLRVWGISATLGNLEEALAVLRGSQPTRKAVLVSAKTKKKFVLETVIPKTVERFPWAGHLGLNQLFGVLRRIEAKRSTLLFTNTRSQAELWFQTILLARPDWLGQIAIHHGSIDRSSREQAEEGLRTGALRCVVCTASLDLGVDFAPVDQVIQVGGPKGVARLLQRAGRSGHQPGAVSRVVCVPAHALELIEFAAAREAVAGGKIESRLPPEAPLDVLVQHLVTVALGGGFTSEALKAEVRATHAYRHLSDADWQWALDFVVHGGRVLGAYPQFHRVVKQGEVYRVTDRFIAQLHRLSVGTISSDAALAVKLLRGGNLGSVEESFLARLKPGDRFTLAGRHLELVRIRDLTAYVRPARKPTRTVPQWLGGSMPLSSQLAAVVRQKFTEAARGIYTPREMKAVEPILRLQQEWSRIPVSGELLIETAKTRDGHHYFMYPFAGRLVHEGLAALVAYRLSRETPRTFMLTMNDYGFALTTPTELPFEEAAWRLLLSPEALLSDMMECLNTTELAKRKFREIARVAGLVFQGFPGRGKPMRQLQSSSTLFYEVFRKYDAQNLLLEQAKREVLRDHLDYPRLVSVLDAIQSMTYTLVTTPQLTPLSFPLWAMWVQGQVSTETWRDRVRRMAEQLEKAAS